MSAGSCFVVTNTSAQHGTILGRIRGKESLLSGATITMGNTTVISGKDGEFSLSIDSGTYTLTISHTGYQKIKKKIVIAGNSRESFEFTMIPNDELGEIVVIGSRSSARRSNLETPVPIDLISSAQLKQTGQTSLTQMLNRSAPSVNATRQTLNEPITLRGLYPDQVLILLNGIRLHNMAWLHDGS